MIYITYPLPPRYHQLTFEEIMAGLTVETMSQLRVGGNADTQTVCVNRIPQKLMEVTDVHQMILKLHRFNESVRHLSAVQDRQTLYTKFYIPKKSGGLREINAPKAELMQALRTLKELLSGFMLADHHTNAYAYIQGRSTLDAVKRHQKWGSRWFLKLDLHDFFGSTTLDFLMRSLSHIYPFNLIVNTGIASISPDSVTTHLDGRQELQRALELCFLHGGLPQGTPISPFLTNVMMIPFDHYAANRLHALDMGKGRTERFIYTRYADDMIISCRVGFPYKTVENFIIKTLAWQQAPFQLNTGKTHYGSRAGSNWMLGVKLNKENRISIGHREKKQFEAMITNYLLDRKNGTPWPLADVQKMHGLCSYYQMVEAERINQIIDQQNQKYGMNFIAQMKRDEALP